MAGSFLQCLLSGSESNLPPSLNEMLGHKQCAEGEKGPAGNEQFGVFAQWRSRHKGGAAAFP